MLPGVDVRAFAARLLRWYARSRRDFPWRNTRDPYRIWISEIMLQQTRAQAVTPYYQAFLERFPDIQSVASAPVHDALTQWAGLGYYSRARNLQKAARQIMDAGGFPRDYEAIRRLPGIGPYTAAAIASIAFELPHAVLDGNVLRVIARIANDAGDIAVPVTRSRFQEIADHLLDRKHPGEFNQAMMELGATVCLPRAPLCLLCPVNELCEARRLGRQDELPVKLRKAAASKVDCAVILIERDGAILMRQRRPEEKRMPGFWELPDPALLKTVRNLTTAGEFRHTIVNIQYRCILYLGTLSRPPKGYEWIAREKLSRMPLSTITKKALKLAETVFC